MMPSAVAMEILCVTNIGSISSKKITVVEKNVVKCRFAIFLLQRQKYFKHTGNVLFESKLL